MIFDRANDADFILWVDADMILFENCTQRLVTLARSDTLYSVAPLLDPVFEIFIFDVPAAFSVVVYVWLRRKSEGVDPTSLL